jgi:hypothetical protein
LFLEKLAGPYEGICGQSGDPPQGFKDVSHDNPLVILNMRDRPLRNAAGAGQGFLRHAHMLPPLLNRM